MATSGSFTTSAYNSKKWLEFYWERTGYSIADNTTTIKWTLTGRGQSGYHKAGNFKVVIDGETVYSSGTRIELYPGTVVASGTKTIKHNTDGTRSFSASAEAGIYYVAVNCTGSNSWSLDSLPRQATLSAAPNFNDEANPTITYSNPAGNSVTSLDACISLTGATDDIAYRAVSKTGSSYTFSLTDAERNVLRNATTGSNSRTVKFFLRTIIGGNTFYSTLDKTFSITNGSPTLSPTVVDTNATTKALTGDANKLVKYYSNAYYTIGAAAKKGASISSQKVTHNGKTMTSATGTFNAVENGTFVFSTTDNRTNTVSKTITKTVIPYVKLTCNQNIGITVDGAASIAIKGNCFSGSFGAVSNVITVQYRWKENGGTYSEWTTVSASTSGSTYSATASLTGLNYKKTYVFQAKVADKLSSATTGEQKAKANPVFDWGENDFAFNVPVKFNAGFSEANAAVAALIDDNEDVPTGDYVIEQGNDGAYAYKKWNSGLMEAWRVSQAQMSITATETAATGAYYTTQTNFKTTNGAAQFVSLEHVQVSVNKNSSLGFWIPVIARTSVSGGVASADIFFTNPTKDATAALSTYVYFIGRWK